MNPNNTPTLGSIHYFYATGGENEAKILESHWQLDA